MTPFREPRQTHGPAPASAAWVRSARLASGLVLFAYVSTHLANHALGLVSLDAMEAGRAWFLALWRGPVGGPALYTALTLHFGLALWSLYRRRHLRMPAWEALQLILGLAIPPLLVPHVVGTRLSHEWFGTDDSYTRLVLSLWHLRPQSGARQTLLLTIAWVHGCMGLYFWLRLRPWYPRLAPLLFAGALLWPVLAWLGFAQAGREVSRLARQPGWVEEVLRASGASAVDPARLDRARSAILAGVGGSLALTLVARAVRQAAARRRGLIRIRYPGAQEVVVPVGFTILEASRLAGIPHASVCGGRGRCSTCRVRVVDGLSSLPPASDDERRVLKRVGAPPNVRLACQLRPSRDVAVAPLLPASARASDGFARPGQLAGDEQEVAVLFADLRAFTRLAERKLPYDVVFLLNRYFEAVGGAIERTGGIANQFTGDGVMALFGVGVGPEEGCRRALMAAGEMVRDVGELSRSLAEELPSPLRIGIGIHTGPAVVGRMGYQETVYLTAVGDTVHVASRLEALTKEYDCQLVISERVAERAGVDVSAWSRHELSLRGRAEPLAIRVVDDAAGLAAAARARVAISP